MTTNRCSIDRRQAWLAWHRCLPALAAGAVLLTGCVVGSAYPPSRPAYLPTETAEMAARSPDPEWRKVRLIGYLPPSRLYRLVGKVAGMTDEVPFVEAAHAARIDIRRQALRLGATLVKIDNVMVPPEAPQTIKPRVLIVGRAYAPIPPPLLAARPRGTLSRHRSASNL